MSGTVSQRGNTVIGGLIVNSFENPIGLRAANFSIDWSAGNFQSVILGASGLTINAPAVGVGFFQLKVIQDSVGSRTLPTFSPAIIWMGGTPTLSTTPGAEDMLQFYCDGRNFYGRPSTAGSGGVTFPLLAPNGSAAAPSYSFANSVDTGMFLSSISRIGFSNGGIKYVEINAAGNNAGIDLGNAGAVKWGASFSNSDTYLVRDAANTLAQRNGVNAQTFRVYNTFTDAANYERGGLRWSANLLELFSEAAGTGSPRAIQIISSVGGSLSIGGTGSAWNIPGSGHLIPNPDNVFDIGAFGATRPRNFYAGTGFRASEAANGKQGVAVLVGGTVTVANTSITANSRIFLTSQVDGGAVGFLRVSARVNATSFTITSSSGTDTSTVAYEIFEPA